jgi:hypothetical protein
MQLLFDTRGVSLVDGIAIVGVGGALLAAIEVEKGVRRVLRGRSAPPCH